MPRSTLVTTAAGDLLCEDAAGRHVHRVGFEPEPWAWTPWQYAEHGRFSGRWDDPDGVWRSIYVGESRLACFLEVLAFARPDPQLQDELGIEEAPEDEVVHPTLAGGLVPESWRWPRRVGWARLTGWYAVPGDKESLPTLRTRFLALAIKLRLPDVDAGVIRLAEPREFTQAIAAWLYDQTAPDGTPARRGCSSRRAMVTTSPCGRCLNGQETTRCRRCCKSRSLSRSIRMIASCKKRCGFTVCSGHRAAEPWTAWLVRPAVRARSSSAGQGSVIARARQRSLGSRPAPAPRVPLGRNGFWSAALAGARLRRDGTWAGEGPLASAPGRVQSARRAICGGLLANPCMAALARALGPSTS